MNKHINALNGELKAFLEKRYKQPYVLNDAMAYSLLAGGKRLRPLLLLETCEAVGGDPQKAMAMAMALEMIHTYSLIHDDLPAMDDDGLRRGLPTNHVVYGEAMAILAGDRLLNLAFELMTETTIASGKKQTLQAMAVIAKAAGKMVDGQAVDVSSTSQNMNKNKLLFIQRNKTAELIIAAMEAGAILGGARSRKTEKIKHAGRYLGMAFQVRDDYLEVHATEEALGKSKSDVANDKFTYITLYGEDQAKKQIKKLEKEIMTLLNKAGLKNDHLQKLIKEMLII